MNSTMSTPFSPKVNEKQRLALPNTVIVEPAFTVGLEEVHAAQRTPSPSPQRRSPRFSPRRPDFNKSVDNSAKNASCMKIMVLEEVDDEGTTESSGHDEEKVETDKPPPQSCQPSKNDVLSVVIEKLTELVETSEREQKRKAAISDSELSSGTSTPRGPISKGHSRSPVRSSRSKLYKCPNCPCLFAVTKKQLRRKNAPICQCCEKAKNAEKFQAQVHAAEQIGLASCDICPYKTSTYHNLLQHLATHPKADIYKCVLCDYVTTKEKCILHHQSTHTQRTSTKHKYQCNSCSYSTTEFANLQSHLQVHDKQGELVLKCSECGFSCRCEKTLREHMWNHVSSEDTDIGTAEMSLSKLPAQKGKAQVYKCLLCGYICEKLCTLKAHVWRHAGEKECSYPIIDDDKEAKSNSEENVSRIAVGCCGENDSVCCMGGEGNKPQCQCPAINIPSTSLTTLQKLAGNTLSKKTRGLHQDRQNQGNTILPPHVLEQLVQELGDISDEDDESFDATSSVNVDHQVTPMDIPPDVDGEVEVVTTRISPIKDSTAQGVHSESEQSNEVLVKIKKISTVRKIDLKDDDDPVSCEEPISKKMKMELLHENIDVKCHSEGGVGHEKDVPEPNLKVLNGELACRSVDSKCQSQDEEQKDVGARSDQESDAIRALSAIDGGRYEQTDLPNNDIKPCHKKKLTNDISEDVAPYKQPCATKVYPISISTCLQLPDAEMENSKEIQSSEQQSFFSENNPSNEKVSQNISIVQKKPESSSQSDATIVNQTKAAIQNDKGQKVVRNSTGPKVTTNSQDQEVKDQEVAVPRKNKGVTIHIKCQGVGTQKSSGIVKQSSFTTSDNTDASAQISDKDLTQQQKISESLLNVIEKFAAETASKPRSSFYCPICGFKAITSQTLKDHIRTGHVKGLKKSSKAPAVFYLKSKKSDSSSQETCENCQRVFIGINAMATHKRSCLPKRVNLPVAESENASEENETNFDRWECIKSNCRETFVDKKDWLKHLDTHDGNPKRQDDPDNTKCSICNREFVGSFALTIHQRSCIRKRWYGCRECDYSAPTPEALANHAVIHKKPYQCEQCSYTSASVSGIRNHMKFHSSVKPYKCHLCDFRGAYPQSLRSHMKAHQTYTPNQLETVEQFKCKLCGYICNHLPSLKSHMWKHASDPCYNYDTVNDAINAVMDAFTTQTLKVPEVMKSTGKDQPVTSVFPGQPGSIAPSSNSTATSTAKAPSNRTTTKIIVKEGIPQLIVINTKSEMNKKLANMGEPTSTKDSGNQQNKSASFERGVLVMKCSRCDFQTVSKEKLMVHFSEHMIEQEIKVIGE